MDFYASDAFLTALAHDFYRAKTVELKTYGVQGSKAHVRLAEINGKRAVHSGPFYDYVKPVPRRRRHRSTVRNTALPSQNGDLCYRTAG